jgi:Mrp family chromosome partitioning ATPase/capsular polysaccharide biosynthesis protein
VKPDLTFQRSLRLIRKRWWLLVICGVLVGGAAFYIVHSKKPHFVVVATLTINDYTPALQTDGPGYQMLSTNPNFPDQWASGDIVTSEAAITTSRNLGGSPSASEIMNGLVMTPRTDNTVSLQYTGGGDGREVVNVLHQYVTVLLSQRTAAARAAISTAIGADRNSVTVLNCPTCKESENLVQNESFLASKARALPGNYSSNFDSPSTMPQAQLVPPGGPPAILAGVGGFAAGAIIGALLALFVGWADTRVRRPDDIDVARVPVIDVNSESDAASIHLLRSELELVGVGTRLGVVAVTRPSRQEGSSGLALAVARSFASVGTPTVLVSADLRVRSVRSEEGLSAVLDSSVNRPPLVPIAQHLQWLPEGSSNARPETLFSAPRVERVVRTLREEAAVIVIDAPTVLEDAETLPLIACSDVVLLTVRPGITEWNPLGTAIALIQRIAKRPLNICYDRAPERSSVPVGERASVPERVHQAIEVPAG